MLDVDVAAVLLGTSVRRIEIAHLRPQQRAKRPREASLLPAFSYDFLMLCLEEVMLQVQDMLSGTFNGD